MKYYSQLFLKAIPIIVLGSIIAIQFAYRNKYQYPFQNPDLPMEQRVNDLVGRMTLDEKISQMMNSAPAIKRLNIPAYDWWNECLHGVGRSGVRVTVFPQAIGLAATFDDAALKRMAEMTSDEARAIYHESLRNGTEGARYRGLTFWTPNINIFRDPRWGRGQETYGEDPYLTGQMGAAMVEGLQGDDSVYLKTSACAKHFAVHSGPEALRHQFDISVSDYELWDTYLPAFKKLVTEAKVSSVMCAYNRFAGQPCCGNNLLMTDILRKQWAFTGYVTSDCGAIDNFFQTHKTHPDAESAAADAVLHGTDLECGGTYHALKEAVKKNLITEKDIDVSVKRLFMIRFRLGMFDPPGKTPYGNITKSVLESPAHHEHAKTLARESIVMLKNEQNILPLKKTISKIAVVGPNADDKNALLGNYNGFPTKIVTVLDGIKAKVSAQTKVIYEKGLDYTNDVTLTPQDWRHQLQNGWKAEYFDNSDFKGAFVNSEMILVSGSLTVMGNSSKAKMSKAARFQTAFIPEKSDIYGFELTSEHGYRLLIDGKRCLDEWYDHGTLNRQYSFKAEAGKKYTITLEFWSNNTGATVNMVTGLMVRNNKQAFVDKLKDAEVVVFVGGISNAFEAEGADKKDINLPAIQTEYMKALKDAGKKVIFVMYTGSAMGIEWEAQNIPAILNAWYAGQDAGTAIADILFGDYNPAGRLPVTFYKSVNDLPPLEDYSMSNRTYRYFKGQPLYPFGYGLSYTKFDYKWAKAPVKSYTEKDIIDFSVAISNKGKSGGDEVVQVYVQYPTGKMLPLKELRQFRRVYVAGNKQQTVRFGIPVADLKKWDAQSGTQKVSKGNYQLFVGGHSEDQKLGMSFNIN